MGAFMRTKLVISAAALAAAFATELYAADVVTTGDLNSISQWYGRAGGLAGSDRVNGFPTGGAKVGISYDAEVAARTNMQRRDDNGGQVGITYDVEVAKRTNMPRGSETQEPSQTAGIGGKTHN